MKENLIITKPAEKSSATGQIVRVNDTAYALIEDLASKSGRSKSYIANRLIEFAYDYVVIKEADEDD